MSEKQARLLEKALRLAIKAHGGQRARNGEPYILHPLRMMCRVGGFEEKLTALLHDVVEDTDYSLKDLRHEGFPEEVVIAVDHLSRRNDESYAEFVERACTNPLARRVKLQDLEDNMTLAHYDELDEKAIEKLAKYHRAWKKAAKETEDQSRSGKPCHFVLAPGGDRFLAKLS